VERAIVEKEKNIHMIEEKISGGKLVYIYFLDMQNPKKIGKIRICGDFFLHPEEKIKKIESKVAEFDLDKSESELEKLIEEELQNCEFAGFSAKDIAKIIKRGRNQ
jgi:hypothetical protein